MKRRRQREFLAHESQEQEYWLSYSDLMAGLLMVFALMLFSALHHYQRRVVDVHDILDVRRRIVTSILETFGEHPALEVDSTTGVVRFREQVLFSEGSAVLRPAGQVRIREFASQYFNLLLENADYLGQLDEIVIEGHTNNNGSYIYNLKLSQDRAFAVMEYLLGAGVLPPQLQDYVTANGRSFSRMILTDAGEPDKERSRRIEIRFRLKDEEIIRRIMERLGAD